MRDFPSSADDVRQLALTLIEFLKKNIKDTHGRQRWTCRNFELLQEFFGKGREGLGLGCCPNDAESEFLWDFVAYIKERGLLFVAESEWDRGESEIAHDFEKLLYPRSPLKLFICRIDEKITTAIEAEAEAKRICLALEHNMETTCAYYSPGEVYIVYCVWFAEKNGDNRDIAYILQIDGEPNYQPIGARRFEAAPK
jgi:hypothetical protein